jgi:hypothetical protein
VRRFSEGEIVPSANLKELAGRWTFSTSKFSGTAQNQCLRTEDNTMELKSLVLTAVTLLLSSCSTTPRPDLYGNPAPPPLATRVVAITPDTRLLNVTDYETVKFLVDDKSFAWYFDLAPRFDQLHLSWIAPPNALQHDVWIIVATDPRKIGE